MNKLIASTLVALAVALSAGSVDAAAIRLSDGITTTTVWDGGPGDTAGADDVVSFIGTVGSWQLNISTGSTLFSDPTDPFMSLASLNATSFSGGTLTIWFTETGFGPTDLTALADIQGLTTGTLKYETFQSVTNTPFGTNALVTSQTFNAGAFSDSELGALVSGGPSYALTQKITITHNSLGVTAFNGTLKTVDTVKTVTVPDGGSTALALGIALASLAALKRRFPAFQK